MSKEQINYLLVLATLLIVWLFFNTFYVNAKKNYGPGPFAKMMSASPVKMPNVPEMPRMPKIQNPSVGMPMRNRGAVDSRNTAPVPAEAATIPLPLVPAPGEKK